MPTQTQVKVTDLINDVSEVVTGVIEEIRTIKSVLRRVLTRLKALEQRVARIEYFLLEMQEDDLK